MYTEPKRNKSLDNISRYHIPGVRTTSIDSKAILLDWNESPCPPPDSVKRELIYAITMGTTLHRYAGVGQRDLIQAICQYIGIPSGGNNVLLFNGSDAALRAICEAYITPGDSVAKVCPTYSQIDTFVTIMGGKMLTTDVDPWNDSDIMTRYCNLLDQEPKICYIANPNNPTNLVLNQDCITALLNVYSNTLFVIDEAYIDFMIAPDNFSLVHKILRYNNLVVLRSFSKAFRLAGMRIGYAVCPENIYHNIDLVRNPKDVNALSCIAALTSLQSLPELYSYIETVRENIEYLVYKLMICNYSAIYGCGPFVLVPVSNARQVTDKLAEQHIYVRCGLDIPYLGEYIRISVGTKYEIDIVCRALADLKARQIDDTTPRYDKGTQMD